MCSVARARTKRELTVVVVIVVAIAKGREMKQKEQLKSILDSEDLTEMERKKIEICQEPGGTSNWLTALPLREAGFSLNMQEFRNALAIRCNISIKGLPETCACGSEFTCDHAMIDIMTLEILPMNYYQRSVKELKMNPCSNH